MPSVGHYECELHRQLQQALKRGAASIVVTASELNLAVGGKAESMNHCFEALGTHMGPSDEVLVATDSGSDLAVRFSLPRPIR